MSIKQKLIISFLTIAIIPILLIAGLSYSNAKKALESTRIEEFMSIGNLKADKIEEFFRHLKEDVRIAQDYFVIKNEFPILTKFASDRTNPEYIAATKMLDSQLKPLLRFEREIVDVTLVNPEGKIVYVSNNAHALADLGNPLPDPDGKAFEMGKSGVYLSEVFRNWTENNKPGMLITAPVNDFNGKFIGVIALEIDMDPIYNLIQDTTGLGETGETLIGKRVGNEVIFINSLRHDSDAALNRKVTIGRSEPIPIQKAAFGANGHSIAVDYRGEEIIAHWEYIPSLDWGLVAKIDTKEAFASIISLRNWIIRIGIIFLSLVVIVALSTAKSVAKPIQALQKGTEVIGSGDLSYKVGTDAKDEVGQLSRAFDNMTQNLKEVTSSRDELNKEITERKESEEKFRSLTDSANEAIISADISGSVISWNNSAEKIFGYAYEEIAGKSLTALMPERYRETHQHGFKSFCETGESRFIGETVELVGLRKDNSEFPLELSLSTWEKNSERFFSGIIRDITKRKQLEEREKVRSVELERIVKSLQTLVSELQLNVKQAKQLLNLVNGEQPRYIEAGDVTLFSHGIELSCNQEGGDHYFVHEVPANGNGDMGKTLISLKDQSGHSVSCIHRSIMTDMFYHSLISENGNKPLEQLLGELNRNMLDAKLLSDDEFFTSIDAEIDHKTLNMHYASGGHPPFIHIRGDKVLAFPETGADGHNPPLATFDSVGISVGELKLRCGDKLLFYTDGLTEATAKHGKDMISTDDLIGIVSKYAGLPVSEIQHKVIAEVSMLSGDFIDPGENQNRSGDDVTILGVEVEDKAAYYEEVWQPQNSKEFDSMYLSLLDRLLKEWRERGFRGDQRLHFVLTESLVNAYLHGNKEDRDKKIFIRWRWGNDLHLEVIDEGEGFDYENALDPTLPENLERESGRGIHMIKHSASQVDWKDSGRHLKTVFEKYQAS